MGIKGFLPCSLLDWPGKVAAVIFIGGCNWRCPYCHNKQLAWHPKQLLDLDENFVLQRLTDRNRDFLDGVVVTGGEPTLQCIWPLLMLLKRRGFQVKLDTNGSLHRQIKMLVKAGLVDCVAMDIKAPYRLYDEITGGKWHHKPWRNSLEYLKTDPCEVIFRTTLIPDLIGPEEVKEIEEWIGRSVEVQPFNKAMA